MAEKGRTICSHGIAVPEPRALVSCRQQCIGENGVILKFSPPRVDHQIARSIAEIDSALFHHQFITKLASYKKGI